MSADDPNGLVSFSTKELLAEIKSDVKQVLVKMEDKADKAAVESQDRRITTIERHGSPGLEEVKANVTTLIATVAGMQTLQASREHLVNEQEEHGRRLDGLESWRNRIVGALTVLVPVAGFMGGIAARYLS